MDEQRVWIKSRRKKRLRLLAVKLVFCLMFTTYPNILETLSVFAAGTQSGDSTVYVTGFAGLPEEVREQTVPVETGAEELTLPDTLEAAVAIPEGEVLPKDAEEKKEAPPEGAEEKTETLPEDAKEETEIPPESAEKETKTPPEGTGEETESPKTEGTETEEKPADDTQPEEETDGENAASDHGGNQTEESQGTELEDSEEAGDTESEEEQDTEPEGTVAETVVTEDDAIPENSGNAGNSGESASSVQTDQTEDAGLTQETHTVAMPEYQAENVITVETLALENMAKQADTTKVSEQTETVMIEGVTWQSETAYDGNTEGTYLFTAVLPEGYALMEGVSLPQITVTVQADSADSVIQALLDRIAALPDAEEYFAKEPDTEEEEAYAEWMEGLYQYAGEALDIQEAYEALTSKQQAQISAEAQDKLAAWAKIAEEMVLLSAEVLADHSSHPVCGASCSHSSAHGSLNWQPFNSTGGELGTGNYYLTGDVVTTSKIIIDSGSTVNFCLNGYQLSYSGTIGEIFSIGDGTLTICDCADGGKVNAGKRPAVSILNSGTFNLYGGTLTGSGSKVVGSSNSQSFVNVYAGTIAGESGCSDTINSVGTVTIGGNAKVTGGSRCAVYNNSENAVINVQDNASISSSSGAGIYSGQGTVIIKGGTVAGNTYGINMNHEKGSLTLEGTPVISGTTAALCLRTAIGATLDNVKVDATGYNGSTLSVMEYDTASREGAYAIKVSNGNKDKFTLINDGDVVYQYKDGGLMLHTHSYTYTGEGAVINEGCTCGHKETATLCQKQDANLTYTGSAIKPVTVSYSNNWAGDKPADRAITYSNNINAGSTATASLKISNVTASLKFTIAQKPLTESMIALASNSYSYTGSAITPIVTVTDGGKTLTGGTDYTVNYSNNISVGTGAKVTVTGKGNYSGSASKAFRITAADINSATVTLSSTTLTYDGSSHTIGVSVKIGSTTLKKGTDYTISGNKGTDAGDYAITITGINGYAGSTKTVTFRIEPKPLM